MYLQNKCWRLALSAARVTPTPREKREKENVRG